MSIRPLRWQALALAIVVGVALISACAGSPATAPKVYRIGWLSGSTQADTAAQVDAFRQAMRQLGYIEGGNITFEVRYADGFLERDAALAAELVALKVDVIVTRTTPETLALKQATSTIPIVAAGVIDPVEIGLVASLARPGGNITGPTGGGADVAQRRLQLLKEAVPGASRVAYLLDASNPSQVRTYQAAQAAAPGLGIDLQPFEVRTPGDFSGAFATIGRTPPDAITLSGSALLRSQLPKILDYIAASRLPSMTGSDRAYVDGGALMYYNRNEGELSTRAASFVDRIFKGANPAELPMEQPSKFDLIINMKTAKALGLTIPPSVLAQATELIK